MIANTRLVLLIKDLGDEYKLAYKELETHKMEVNRLMILTKELETLVNILERL